MSGSRFPQEFWDKQINIAEQATIDWLWHGFLARGSLTLLTGLWKSGKTTLLSLLLAEHRDGGTLVADR